MPDPPYHRSPCTQGVSLRMARHDLEGIPRFGPPPGFRLRPYEPGDEQAWVDIHLAADELSEICLDLFRHEFPAEPGELSKRQFYLCEGVVPVGTVTAWRETLDGEVLGRVHWVAMLPRLQGRGLARPLLSAVCLRLAELGHGRAYLTTNTLRVPAINLYLKFGFCPWPRSDAEAEAWKSLAESGNLKYPLEGEGR